MKNNFKKLDANLLKLIAVIAMTVDHVAWYQVALDTPEGQLLHFIGRLTMPVMCYFISEGYYHTRNLKKYILRLSVFAVISDAAYRYYETGRFFFLPGQPIRSFSTSIIFSLLLGLLALSVWKSAKIKRPLKIFLVCLFCFLSLPADYSYKAVLTVLVFGIFHDSFQKQALSYSVILVFYYIQSAYKALQYGIWWIYAFRSGMILAIPLLYCYNGKLGRSKKANTFFKWFFYLYYPAHLFLLGYIRHR